MRKTANINNNKNKATQIEAPRFLMPDFINSSTKKLIAVARATAANANKIMERICHRVYIASSNAIAPAKLLKLTIFFLYNQIRN